VLALSRWRRGDLPLRIGTRALAWVAAVVLIVGSALDGYLVYHGGAGIDANLLKPGLHEETSHDN